MQELYKFLNYIDSRREIVTLDGYSLLAELLQYS